MDFKTIQLVLIRKGRTLLTLWENKVQRPQTIYPRPMIEFIAKQNNSGSPLVGAEIGVDAGENAFFILNTVPIKKLFLIDPYLEYDEDKSNVGWENRIQADYDNALTMAKRRLNPFGDRIEFIVKKSKDAANDIPDNMDFVYIDGNHQYEFVRGDMVGY